MLRLNIFLFIELLIICNVITYVDIPNVTISNGFITANLYLPDINNGYYQSTRFDWGGIISQLEYRGHSYFGQWFDEYDAKKHDAICGPVDEFGAVGFENAKVGGTFLKIGVGMLKKSADESYNSFKYYEIGNLGERTMNKKSYEIEFIHTLNDTSGYAYEYRKNVCLTEDKPELVISYYLKNTGNRKIKTTVYNHNFFMIDHQQTGPDITIKFPFELTGDGLGVGELAHLNGNEIRFIRPLEREDRVLIRDVKGHNKSLADHSFSIENHRTGAGVKLIGNKPLEHLVYWSCSTTSCPEPYIKIDLVPGEEFSWENRYEFYTF